MNSSHRYFTIATLLTLTSFCQFTALGQSSWFLRFGPNISKATSADKDVGGFAYDYFEPIGGEIGLGYEKNLSNRFSLIALSNFSLHGLSFNAYNRYTSNPPEYSGFSFRKYNIWCAGLRLSASYKLSDIFEIEGGYEGKFVISARSKSEDFKVNSVIIYDRVQYTSDYDIPSRFVHGPTLELNAHIDQHWALAFGCWADLTSVTRFPSNWGWPSRIISQDANIDILVYSLTGKYFF